MATTLTPPLVVIPSTTIKCEKSFCQRLDTAVVAFLYAPHRVALAAVDIDGFFVRFYPRVLVVQVHRHAVAIEDVATERILSALVVHCPLRAVDFQVMRVAVNTFAEDLRAVEDGFAIANVSVSGEPAYVAEAPGAAVTVA